MIKLLGKAIKGTTVQFTQVDQVQALTFDKFADSGIKPVEPNKPTGLHIIKSEQVTIEGVPLLCSGARCAEKTGRDADL